MKILKASAGSGKTYSLAHTYIRLLLDAGRANRPYRHILAVTFTNKATAEMKARILQELSVHPSPEARGILTDILHDYSAFSVCTIDSFFQRALKAFAREIGQFGSYQLELDAGALVEEAMDRVLDSLTEDVQQKDLLDWLSGNARNRLAQGKRYVPEEGLAEIGKRLRSTEFRTLLAASGFREEELFGKKRLESVRKACRDIITAFEDRVRACGGTVAPGVRLEPLKSRESKANPALADVFEDAYRRYLTAWVIAERLPALGVAGEFRQAFSALLREKNVLPIDDTNTLLRDIIDGSDTPFVYEKLGVRYDHFLLDEFQDTSWVQWDNFLPLLCESESRASAFGNLIVGDVKQSIYRWRDSDWRLLGSEVKKQFPQAEEEAMPANWRSTRTVVEFNNGFFAYAAGQLGVSGSYADVSQQVKRKDEQAGSVKVSFVDKEEMLPAVLQSVRDAEAQGASLQDIAILVRSNRQGANVADYLMQHRVNVVSEDSLDMQSSWVVQRLLALLHFYERPEDKLGSFLARSLQIAFPATYHSLPDFCEALLCELQKQEPEICRGETVFIEAFMDKLQQWVDVHGNNLLYFLRDWEEHDGKHFIASQPAGNAVRILTIHKSKGLEYPYVIFPFADSVKLSDTEEHWGRPEIPAGSPDAVLDGLYPVLVSGKTVSTSFWKMYDEQAALQRMDAINLYYVALTRAVCGLHVIAGRPARDCCQKLAKGAYSWKKMSELLYAYVGCCDGKCYGTPYDFSRLPRKE
ncbi:MAG: UvrD-helicase domain-containing protein, partial [Bacteroidales bacterium]|nr:UvrD-helicase domain-containing protein [Bacteroidales bacterium]